MFYIILIFIKTFSGLSCPVDEFGELASGLLFSAKILHMLFTYSILVNCITADKNIHMKWCKILEEQLHKAVYEATQAMHVWRQYYYREPMISLSELVSGWGKWAYL